MTRLAALVMVSMGCATATPIQPAAFYISHFEVTDPAGIKPYSARVESTFLPFGGRYIVRGGAMASLEGEAPKRMVIISFESKEKAQAWYDSPAYRELRPIRQKSAASQVYIVEGIIK